MPKFNSLNPLQQNASPVDDKLKYNTHFYRWLYEIYTILGFSNNRFLEFTPSITNTSSSSEITTTGYYKLNNGLLHFSCSLTSVNDITLSSSVLNVKSFDNPVVPLASGSCTLVDASTLVGSGAVVNGLAYLPNVTSKDIKISGFYLVDQIR